MVACDWLEISLRLTQELKSGEKRPKIPWLKAEYDPKLLLLRPKIMILYVSKVTKVTKIYNFRLLTLPK